MAQSLELAGVAFTLVALLPPSVRLQRLSPPGAPSLVCLNGPPVLSAEGRGLKTDAVGSEVELSVNFFTIVIFKSTLPSVRKYVIERRHDTY